MTQEQVSKPALDDLIPLCVSGSSFAITYKTLKRSPYFKRMIKKDRDSVLYVNHNEIFLDRSDRLFEHVLQYLQTDDIQVDDESTLRELLVESEDYELPDMFQKVMDKLALIGMKEYHILHPTQLAKSIDESSAHRGKVKKSIGSQYSIISELKFEYSVLFRCQLYHTYSCTCARVQVERDGNERIMYLVSKNKD